MILGGSQGRSQTSTSLKREVLTTGLTGGEVRAERTLTEINQELRWQLAKYKQDFRDLTEKFLISQATSYSLANQLQKYSKCSRSCSPKQ